MITGTATALEETTISAYNLHHCTDTNTNSNITQIQIQLSVKFAGLSLATLNHADICQRHRPCILKVNLCIHVFYREKNYSRNDKFGKKLYCCQSAGQSENAT